MIIAKGSASSCIVQTLRKCTQLVLTVRLVLARPRVGSSTACIRVRTLHHGLDGIIASSDASVSNSAANLVSGWFADAPLDPRSLWQHWGMDCRYTVTLDLTLHDNCARFLSRKFEDALHIVNKQIQLDRWIISSRLKAGSAFHDREGETEIALSPRQYPGSSRVDSRLFGNSHIFL